MPIYEYHCKNCDHHFDVLQKVSEPPVAECPKCPSNDVAKLVSAAGFQLKGTGWYATDFKSKPSAPQTKSTEPTKTSTTESSSKGDDKA